MCVREYIVWSSLFCYCFHSILQSMATSHSPKVYFDEWKTIIFERKFPCLTASTYNNCMNKQKPNGLCFYHHQQHDDHHHHAFIESINFFGVCVRCYAKESCFNETEYLTSTSASFLFFFFFFAPPSPSFYLQNFYFSFLVLSPNNTNCYDPIHLLQCLCYCCYCS